MSKYDEAMQMLCDAARFKMLLNSHKGDIEALSTEGLIENLLKELDEINEATAEDNYEKILVETADAFNYLVAIAHNAIASYRRRKEK